MSEINHTLVQKLLSLALDGAAAPGEVENAGHMLIKHLRKGGVKADEFLRGGGTRVVERERVVYRDRIVYQDRVVEKIKIVHVDRPVTSDGAPPPPPEVVMPFGKHKGVPVAEIDPGYLQWVLDNCDRLDAYLVAEIRRVLKLDQD
jgi:hypothetical protein